MSKTYRQPAKPTPNPCHRCKRKVLAGLDARAAALPVVIDAEVLTREGELVNIVAGVEMYATNTQGDILRRNASEILKHGEHLKMHRVHECGVVTEVRFVQASVSRSVSPNTDEVLF